ncbi:MAG: protein-disulfide reductase DsbD domain-containing protein [Paracoccaceae bacterium]
MIRTLALVAAVLSAPAFAETQDDVVSATFLPGWRMADGNYMAALHLALAPEWKTYWRAPGEAGIPPVFDWSGSRNVKSVALHWPSPRVITLNGMQSIGYLDALTLPIEVTPIDPSQPIDVVVKMAIGVCHDICMPAALKLSAQLQGDGAKDPQILAALHNRPKTAKEAGLANIGCAVAPIDDGLHITAQIGLPAQGGLETVVFETGDASVWVATASSRRDGKVLTAATDFVPSAGTPFALDRSSVTVTVLAQDHSVEIKGCPAP